MIHPTAIVSPDAQIGKNVEIGPYAVIEDNVKIGDNCYIDSHVKICRYTTVGSDCCIYYNALVGAEPQDHRFYREKQVLNAGDPAVRTMRLALCFAVRDILADGLAALTIGIPDAM